MYTYPNGLTCDASPMRIKLFECTVPPLMALATIIGFPAIAAYMKSPESDQLTFRQTLLLFDTVMALWVLWMVVCALIAFLIFQVWCRPVDEEQARPTTPAKRQQDETRGGSETCSCCCGRLVDRT